MNSPDLARPHRVLSLALAGALVLLAVMLFASHGMSDIDDFWLPWTRLATTRNIVSAYRLAHADYPPGSQLMLAMSADFGRLAGLSPLLALKTTLCLFLFGSCAIVWDWTKRLDYAALVGLILVVPTLGLSYIDIFFAPFLLIALWAFSERRFAWGMAFFVAAIFIKWQPLIFAPFIGVYLWRNLPRKQALILTVGIPLAALTFFGLIYGGALWSAWKAAASHTIFSGNATNLPWVFTFLIRASKPDLVGPLVDGRVDNFSSARLILTAPFKLVFVGFYGWLLLRAIAATGERATQFATYLRLATLGFIAYYLFNTGVHENHLFAPALAGAALFYLSGESGIALFCALFLNLNCVLFYGFGGLEPAWRVIGGVDLTVVVAVAACVGGLILLVRRPKISATEARISIPS